MCGKLWGRAHFDLLSNQNRGLGFRVSALGFRVWEGLGCDSVSRFLGRPTCFRCHRSMVQIHWQPDSSTVSHLVKRVSAAVPEYRDHCLYDYVYSAHHHHHHHHRHRHHHHHHHRKDMFEDKGLMRGLGFVGIRTPSLGSALETLTQA